jgi:hypothetical protein
MNVILDGLTRREKSAHGLNTVMSFGNGDAFIQAELETRKSVLNMTLGILCNQRQSGRRVERHVGIGIDARAVDKPIETKSIRIHSTGFPNNQIC